MALDSATHRDCDRLPPGRFGLPILGQTLQFFFDSDFALNQYRRYGPIFKTRLFGQPTVFFVGPEAVEAVLSSQMDCFSWGEGWPAHFRILLGESLFLQDGEEHRRNRKLMMPAFHGAALAQYFDTMMSISQRYIDRWEALERFVWFEEMKQLTFEIASELLVGAESGEDVARLSRLFTDLTNGLFSLLAVPIPGTRFGRAIAARNQLLQHIETVVRQRQQHPTRDALSLLVQARDEDGNTFSLEELKAQAMLLLFAGHETTTSMLTWLCLELGRHPQMLERAQAEQMELADRGTLDLAQLSQMPYLDRLLMEVERLHPPVGGGFRRVVKPFEFGGYCVPAGWLALYSIIATHRLPELYPDPDRFDPDRFVAREAVRGERRLKPYSLIGFGGGPRVCLGMAFAKLEMKIVASLLLRDYEWALLPHQRLEDIVVPTRRPKDGLRVRFRRRT
ncbi:MAG: cytochrome P450 [Cyanobacteria bacterium SID2]|nr:cytochrome P450 [Cyanobacteria bacterium SID2]MBP0005151.1 cytochrome P450 [Cyanobacteria bacterium SBC]